MSAPPRSTSPSSSNGSLSRGQPTRLSANSGVAPIAYKSENALVAAMRPKSYGSSTMGVKKSTVATIARSGVIWKTAASSRLEASTRIRGSVATGTWRKTCANSDDPSLQAQPAPSLAGRRREELPPYGIGDEEPDQKEKQPPPTAAERVEPQRPEQGRNH